MQDDHTGVPPEANAGKALAGVERSDKYRERMRQVQAIRAQAERARAAGGQPSDDEAARLIAEFHARGGQVTVCPAGDALQASPEQIRSRPDKQGAI